MTSAVHNKYSCTSKVLSLKPVNVKKFSIDCCTLLHNVCKQSEKHENRSYSYLLSINLLSLYSTCKIILQYLSFKFSDKQVLVRAAPVAEWVSSLNFSALNHSIISQLCVV